MALQTPREQGGQADCISPQKSDSMKHARNKSANYDEERRNQSVKFQQRRHKLDNYSWTLSKNAGGTRMRARGST
jgi:hypothetical protein